MFALRVRLCALSLLSFSNAEWPLPSPTSSGHWASAGNHRFRITVPAGVPAGGLVEAVIPWRRRDAYVARADTFITASAAGVSPVSRCARNASTLSPTSAAFTFAADAGAGDYFLYYLPFATCEYNGGACQYNADVAYAPPVHCLDAPWWPAGAAPAAPSAVAYEASTPFDAFSDMEFLMAPAELAAFAAGGPLLITEDAANPARAWGGGGGGGGNSTPFCVFCGPCNAWYLKTGGDPAVTAGWDHGANDKCCSADATSCHWFSTLAACQAFRPTQCRACGAGDEDLGCPAWGGPPGRAVPVPRKYLDRAPASLAAYAASLAPNQNFSFQVLLLAPAGKAATVTGVAFSPAIPGVALTCFNTEAVDFWGRASSPQPVARGLLPLWVGVAVDRGAAAGAYNVSGEVRISVAGGANATLPLALALTVRGGAPLPDGGDAPPRLGWLNSRLANDDASVPQPYAPLRANGSALPAAFSLHGKTLAVGANGLPAEISTFGASASPALDARGPTQLLAGAGVSVRVALNGAPLAFPAFATAAFAGNGSAFEWAAAATDSTGAVALTIAGSVDFSGYISLAATVAPAAGGAPPAGATVAFELVAEANPANLLYGMGLGSRGGYWAKMFTAPATSRAWAWDGVNGNNGVWAGSTTGGLLLKLKGGDPLWQASVPFDDDASPPPPPEWANGGASGIRLDSNGTFTGFSGAMPFAAGAPPLTWRASLLVTPVHNLNLSRSWELRYAQLDGPANYTFLAEHGASVVNMHQGNVVNPWINYPYLTNDLMNSTAAACQSLGMRFSVYNTMRELSNRCLETFAMLAMGEAYVPSSGGSGADWLREHVGSGYLPAWSSPLPSEPGGNGFVLDAAMRVVALSRWNNFYVEGIQQMMRDFRLDGVYLDEIAYDRVTMMRMKKLLDGRDGVIDHHADAGFVSVSPAMVYMEHYPFLSKLWYGEGFNYDAASPDYWLVEMSGLCWGLTADMLRYEGMTPEHFKGMLFAQSNRWQSGMEPATVATDAYVPVALWALWRDVRIQDAVMHGWWLADVDPSLLPVAANATGVRVTTYALPARAVVAVASFLGAPLVVQLAVNNSILKLPGSLGDYCLAAPVLPPFQPTALKLRLTDAFTVPAGQGHLFLIDLC